MGMDTRAIEALRLLRKATEEDLDQLLTDMLIRCYPMRISQDT
jgi:hypothetical protein